MRCAYVCMCEKKKVEKLNKNGREKKQIRYRFISNRRVSCVKCSYPLLCFIYALIYLHFRALSGLCVNASVESTEKKNSNVSYIFKTMRKIKKFYFDNDSVHLLSVEPITRLIH